MKSYDLLYVNGDSYSARTDFPVYSDHLQDLTGIPVINRAIAGSNNQRIMRSTINDLLELPRENRVLCVIGFSFVTRDEIWYEGSDPGVIKKIPDLDDQNQGRLITADFVTKTMGWSEAHDILIDININRQLAHFYCNLFCFVNTLQNLGVDYLVFSAANNQGWRNEHRIYFDKWPLYQKLKQDPRILDLHDFYIGKWAADNQLATTDTLHLLKDGHVKFADFILDRLNDLYT